MAENKKSFVLYADLIHTVRHLSKEDAGELFMHILSYVNDENPTTETPIVKVSFEPVKQQLKRDLIKWENQLNQRREAGKRSAEIRSTKSNERSTVVNEIERNSTVSVNVTDNVTVNDTVSDIKKPVTINIGNRTFTGTTSEWLMLNKEQAIEVLMMNEYPDLNIEAVFTTLDNSTVNYQFKDDNHPFNYFKSICNALKSKSEKPPPYKRQVGKQTAIDILNINELAKHGISED